MGDDGQDRIRHSPPVIRQALCFYRNLGKDVPPEDIAKATVEQNAPIVCLSALMTTTVPAMEETIKLLRKEAPSCKVIVGGAVLNREYAEKIGADMYGKDAMSAVRYAQTVCE